METTYMGGKPRIDNTRGLSAIDFIIKGAMEKCVFDIKLIDGSGFGNIEGENDTDGGQFHNGAKSFIEVNAMLYIV
jgi:hypothetical protein